MIQSFRHLSLLVVLVLVLGGCRDFSVDADESGNANLEGDKVATLDVPFEMQFGQRVFLDETEYSVEFSLVAEDSRCAVRVQCAQAGRATVLLTVTDAQFVSYQLVVHIPGLVPTPYNYNDIIQFQGLRYRLLRVNPYPVDGVQRDMSDYKILLEVEPVDA